MKNRAIGFGLVTYSTVDESILAVHYCLVLSDPERMSLMLKILGEDRPLYHPPEDPDEWDKFNPLIEVLNPDEKASLDDYWSACRISRKRRLDTVLTFPAPTQRFFIFQSQDLTQPPAGVLDACLRLYLMSFRLVVPDQLNLDGIFGILPNVLWTNIGAFDARIAQQIINRAQLHGVDLHVHALDKFPPMLQFVAPSNVRVADASRVRLGAHLGEGTVVMHEGFVNMGAGTRGKAMIEGRISLGDNCIVEAGLYLTAGKKVLFHAADGSESKWLHAKELSGRSNILYRQNSQTGKVEAIEQKNSDGIKLNDALHQTTPKP